jgi:hypothetical protein
MTIRPRDNDDRAHRAFDSAAHRRLTRRSVAFAAGVVLCLTASGCGEGEAEKAATPRAIDEVRGSIDDVGLMASKRDVAGALGPYSRPVSAYPSVPADSDDEKTAGPWSVDTGPHHLGPGGRHGEQVTLRYPGVAFYVLRDRVFGFVTTSDGSRTQRGVAVGDPLAHARRSYPHLDCSGAISSDTSAEQAPSCSGFVGKGRHRWIYFGGDPIRSITVMEHSASYYAY